MDRIKKGKFVYRNEDGMKKMHAFYGKTLIGKWVSTLIGFPLLAAIIAWLVSRI